MLKKLLISLNYKKELTTVDKLFTFCIKTKYIFLILNMKILVACFQISTIVIAVVLLNHDTSLKKIANISKSILVFDSSRKSGI